MDDFNILNAIEYNEQAFSDGRKVYELCNSDYYVYFHRHDSKPNISGHIHLMKFESEQCFHLGALEIDSLGKPVGFFLVEPWVTGEVSLTAESLFAKFAVLFDGYGDSKEISWLSRTLSENKAMILSVLARRDSAKVNIARSESDKREGISYGIVFAG